MASSETWAESSSVLGTKPRTREEVREEVREEIRLLDLARPAPEDKLRLEREAVLGSIGDVELFEKSWRKTASETLPEIERKIDAMDFGGARTQPAQRQIPSPKAPPKPEEADAWEPAPGRPARGGKAPASRLTPAEQKAVAKHLGGAVQRATILFATSRGRVVEVTFKHGDASRTIMVMVGEKGAVSTLDEIGAKLDALPMPSAAPRSAPEEPTEAAPAGGTDLVAAIEGIGEVYGKKLAASGVTTLEEFAASDPAVLAAETGISPELVRKWHDMALLQGLRGIGPQFSELLVRAGVPTIAQLAACEAEDLARRINKYQDSLGQRVTRATITSGLVQNWIDAARAAAPPPAPTAPPAEEDVADEEEAGAAGRKKFGLSRKKKAPESAETEAEPAAKKKKFGLKLRKG